MVAFRLLQRCVTIDVTVSSTQSVTRCAPKIVQHQNLGVQRRLVRLAIHGPGSLVVPAANAIQQRLEIEEHAFESTLDQPAQRRHRQMRLAGARRSDEQQPRFRNTGIIAHVTAHRQHQDWPAPSVRPDYRREE